MDGVNNDQNQNQMVADMAPADMAPADMAPPSDAASRATPADAVGGRRRTKKHHGGKRHGNASLKAWVKFVKKVQREEKVSYKEAMMLAKKRKDKGEKWRGGALEEGDVATVEPMDSSMMDSSMMNSDMMDSDTDMEGGRRRRRRHRTQKRSKSRRARSSRRRHH
jgi:hypothetical protein